MLMRRVDGGSVARGLVTQAGLLSLAVIPDADACVIDSLHLTSAVLRAGDQFSRSLPGKPLTALVPACVLCVCVCVC